MKKTDIAMLILIASVSVIIAYAIISAIPGLKPSNEAVNVKTINAYSSEIEEPDTTVFNSSAINPTVDVTIGGTSSDNQ